MTVDFKRVLASAIDSALEENRAPLEAPKKRRISGLQAVAAGAAVAAVARFAVSRLPGLPIPNISALAGDVRDRVAGLVDLEDEVEDLLGDDLLGGEDDDAYDEDDEDNEDDEPDDDDDDGPRGHGDEEPTDDVDDEPEDEGDYDEYDDSDEDYDDEYDEDDEEYDEDEEEAESDPRPAPALDLDGAREAPPVARTRRRVNPAARPPKPPRSRSQRKARAR